MVRILVYLTVSVWWCWFNHNMMTIKLMTTTMMMMMKRSEGGWGGCSALWGLDAASSGEYSIGFRSFQRKTALPGSHLHVTVQRDRQGTQAPSMESKNRTKNICSFLNIEEDIQHNWKHLLEMAWLKVANDQIHTKGIFKNANWNVFWYFEWEKLRRV